MVKARWWIVGLFGASWAFARLIANDPVQTPAHIQPSSTQTKFSKTSAPSQARPMQDVAKATPDAAEAIGTRYVSGHRVALRDAPSKEWAHS